MEQGDDRSLHHVVALVVPDLVRQHRHDLLLSEPVEQRVEERDALVAAEPGEERVGLARPPRSVHHEYALEREGDRAGVGQDGVA